MAARRMADLEDPRKDTLLAGLRAHGNLLQMDLLLSM